MGEERGGRGVGGWCILYIHMYNMCVFSGDMDVAVLSKYIMEQKRVYPPLDGRIKFVNCAHCTASSSALLLVGVVLASVL